LYLSTKRKGNSMKDRLFSVLTWCLLAGVWAFAVFYGAPRIEWIARIENERHEAYAPSPSGLDFTGWTPLDDSGYEIPPPEWPRWLVNVALPPAEFAGDYPYWTMIGGVGAFAWVRLFIERRRRGKADHSPGGFRGQQPSPA
jgi:hypothetical protein